MARNWSDYRARPGAEPWRGGLSGDDSAYGDNDLIGDYGSTQTGLARGYRSSGGPGGDDRYEQGGYDAGYGYGHTQSDETPSRRYREEARHHRPRMIVDPAYGRRYPDPAYYARDEYRNPAARPHRDRPGERYLGDYGGEYGYTGRGHGYGMTERPAPERPRYARDDDRAYRDYSDREAQYDRDDRGFWSKAGDEVASWFGDRDAAERRQMDHVRMRGPKNYSRSTERIREDVCDRLGQDWIVDASDVEVNVSGKDVTLTGTVPTRDQRRRAEDIAERVAGVDHVQNNIRVASLSSPQSSQGEGSVTKTSSGATPFKAA